MSEFTTLKEKMYPVIFVSGLQEEADLEFLM